MNKIFHNQKLQDQFFKNGFVEIGPLHKADLNRLVNGFNKATQEEKK